MLEGFTTTILGHTQTGKTCYFVALYNLLKAGMACGNSEFSLGMPAEKIADDTYLRRLYRNLERKSLWPDANPADILTEYQLYLYRTFSERIDFNWLDYSGELIEEQGGEMADSYTKLISRLERPASSVLFPLEGELFTQPIPEAGMKLTLYRQKHGFGEFNDLMGKYIHWQNEKKRPAIVVFLITKYDECEKEDFQEIISSIHRLFPRLFRSEEGTSKIVGIIPVSLGHGPREKFVYDPYQIHLPLMFILFHEIEFSVITTCKNIEEAKGVLAKESETFWGPILDKLDLNDDTEAARARIKESEETKRILLPLREAFREALCEGKLAICADGIIRTLSGKQ